MRQRASKAARPRAAFAAPLPSRRAARSELAPSLVEDVVRSAGQPLDGATRSALEPHFGHDIARVRVHTDARAAQSARAVDARAFSVGRDIVFDSGRYAPHSAEGRHLLAHELAHVAQQAPPGTLQRAPNRALPWSKRLITAGMGYFGPGPWSSINSDGDYDSSNGTNAPFSDVFSGDLCTKRPLPLDFAFHVDRWDVPRPQPFAGGHVSMTLTFLTERGRTIPIVRDTSQTQYLTPGHALLTGMPLSVSFAPPEPGTLLVSLAHMDPTSGELAVYSDEVPVVDCEPDVPKNEARETRFFAVVPDPVNDPHEYHLLGMQDDIMEEEGKKDDKKPRGLTTRIEEDLWGYFYVLVLGGKSKKIYIEDPHTK